MANNVTFPAIRDVPDAGVPQWQSDLLDQLKEAVEILTGARGSGARAVVNKNVTIAPANNITMQRVTAVANGAYSQQEFLNLMNNVQELAVNVISLQNQVNELIKQLEA
jgi:hypothetical protein